MVLRAGRDWWDPSLSFQNVWTFVDSMLPKHLHRRGPDNVPQALESTVSTRDHVDTYVGFPIIRGTILGVPLLRTVVFWGLSWGPAILGDRKFSAAASEA